MSGAEPPGRPGLLSGGIPVPEVLVPEVRDFARINAELSLLLDAGHPHVRLAGADGQRLLVRGLRGPWRSLVEVQGDAGPELAADLNAPNLVVVCTGSVLDGAGRGMVNGRLLVLGDAGAVAGYAQSGGTIVVAGSVGPRAGLDQSGGRLVLRGPVGRLAGERQSGGLVLVLRGPIGPFTGHGRSGGRFVGPESLGEDDVATLLDEAATFGPWWPSTLSIREGGRRQDGLG